MITFLLYHKSGNECLVFLLKVRMHGEAEDAAGDVFADGECAGFIAKRRKGRLHMQGLGIIDRRWYLVVLKFFQECGAMVFVPCEERVLGPGAGVPRRDVRRNERRMFNVQGSRFNGRRLFKVQCSMFNGRRLFKVQCSMFYGRRLFKVQCSRFYGRRMFKVLMFYVQRCMVQREKNVLCSMFYVLCWAVGRWMDRWLSGL